MYRLNSSGDHDLPAQARLAAEPITLRPATSGLAGALLRKPHAAKHLPNSPAESRFLALKEPQKKKCSFT